MPPSLQSSDTLLSQALSTQTLIDVEYLPTEEDSKSTIKSASRDSVRPGLLMWYWENWKWESSACLLVLAAPLVILGTIYPHSGQPLPQWPFNVSINSLLSVYALLFKASIGFILTSCIGQLQWKWFALESRPLYDMVRFDQATRDAGGALSLIWRQRIQQPLATLGCAITILAVAVDPFVQQLLQPADCSVEMPGDGMTASLPVATYFERYGNGSLGPIDHTALDGPRTRALESGRIGAIENAIYRGVFNPEQHTVWQCPTGNCSFPTYGTISLCSSCEDTSADVVVSTTCSHLNSSDHDPASELACTADSEFAVKSTYNISDYVSLNSNVSIGSQTFDGPQYFNVAAAAFEVFPSSVDSPRGYELIFRFLIGATANTNGRIDWTTPEDSACTTEAEKESWSCRGFGAATCTIKPCVQVYNATVSAGTFEENLIATMADTDWGQILDTDGRLVYSAMLDSQCSSKSQTESIASFDGRGRWVPFDLLNVAVDPNSGQKSLPSKVKSLIEDGCLYVVETRRLFDILGHYLDGNVQGVPSVVSIKNNGIESVSDMADFEGSPVIQSIYNSGHTDFGRVESTVANISDSLTAYIRTLGRTKMSDSTRTAQGKVYHYAICLQVKWLWLLFPSILSSLTVLLFFLVIEVSRRQNAPVWKASPLVWILRTDGPSNCQISSPNGTCKAMQDRSRQIAVHLGEGDDPRIGMVDMKDPHLD